MRPPAGAAAPGGGVHSGRGWHLPRQTARQEVGMVSLTSKSTRPRPCAIAGNGGRQRPKLWAVLLPRERGNMLEECDRPAGRWPALRQEREGRISRVSCRGPSDGSGSGRGMDGKAQNLRALPYLRPLTNRGG